eukprot:1181378-Prorocentrum_minimum.AAC.1
MYIPAQQTERAGSRTLTRRSWRRSSSRESTPSDAEFTLLRRGAPEQNVVGEVAQVGAQLVPQVALHVVASGRREVVGIVAVCGSSSVVYAVLAVEHGVHRVRPAHVLHPGVESLTYKGPLVNQWYRQHTARE